MPDHHIAIHKMFLSRSKQEAAWGGGDFRLRVVGGEHDRWLGMVIRLNMSGEMPAFDLDGGYGEILRRYG